MEEEQVVTKIQDARAVQIAFDFEPDPISDHYIVSEANALIEARTNLDIYEERLIYILASRINPKDTHFRTCYFKVKEIADKLDLKDKNLYKRLREIVRRLSRKQVVIDDKYENTTLEANWLAASKYYHGKGIIELEFSQMLGPYLLQLKNNFTSFKLWNVLYLKSSYSSKLYKMLKQYLPLGKRKFATLAELKDALEIEDGKYVMYSHLKNRILLHAQRELADKTDIKFDIEEIKNGNKVVGITFLISPNPRTPRLAINGAESFEHESIYDTLKRFDIDKKTATELLVTYGENHIRANIRYVYEKQQNAEISSLSGYIIKAIKENYAKTAKTYTPDDENDRSTSIEYLNNRINSTVDVYHLMVRDNVKSTAEAERELLLSLIKDINSTSDHRIRKNMRPLQESDIVHPKGKAAFKYHS
ncbi:replication initiation protein [Paenibacillus gansuensis]|uniref:Replication initiation protein n=1 Tax=Paenibacillus gansuensis TaxID=306542 RepID=A0ABW5PJY5_9BACL